ncbi:outer membrane beta-barrel protein [uncultured Aquimarina sp.]|uniref:outer membrane beta-barrel protein n=1 Tax=uncultured Aquimarina sp. TaxID=575652 RepID=UPI002615C9CD|nr:outer membrane beta-barrel protein [uncultured Aquimarina sp.]
MKRTFITIFLIAFAIKTFSQDSKFSAELNFPYPFDNNFIADNYNGIIDIGAKYRFINSRKIAVGISINAGYFKSNSELTRFYGDLKIKSYLLQPKFFAELNLYRFHPFVGIGYTSMIFKSSVSDDEIAFLSGNGGFRDGFSVNNSQSGIDLNAGLQYDITKKIFIQAQFDYIILSREPPIINSKYNTNVNLLKFGLGYRI